MECLTPGGIGQQLMAEADAEIGPLHIEHEFSNGCFFFAEPRVLVLLPNILRTAHDDHQVEWVELRYRLAFIELDGRPAKSVLAKEVEKYPRMFNGDVL